MTHITALQAERDAARSALDKAWAQINAEGGGKPGARPHDFDAGVERGYWDAINDALKIIESVGGMDPLQRARTVLDQTAAKGE